MLLSLVFPVLWINIKAVKWSFQIVLKVFLRSMSPFQSSPKKICFGIWESFNLIRWQYFYTIGNIYRASWVGDIMAVCWVGKAILWTYLLKYVVLLVKILSSTGHKNLVFLIIQVLYFKWYIFLYLQKVTCFLLLSIWNEQRVSDFYDKEYQYQKKIWLCIKL